MNGDSVIYSVVNVFLTTLIRTNDTSHGTNNVRVFESEVPDEGETRRMCILCPVSLKISRGTAPVEKSSSSLLSLLSVFLLK